MISSSRREFLQVGAATSIAVAAGTNTSGRMQSASVWDLTAGRADGWRSSIYYHYDEFPGAPGAGFARNPRDQKSAVSSQRSGKSRWEHVP